MSRFQAIISHVLYVKVDISRDRVSVIVILWSVANMESSSSYVAIGKGRGFVYASDNQLYKQVKKEEL